VPHSRRYESSSTLPREPERFYEFGITIMNIIIKELQKWVDNLKTA
jgi:hypothetical protein